MQNKADMATKRKSLGQTSVTEQETELERLESKPVGAENMESRLPRKQSVVWIAMKKVKTKLSLTEEGATPVNWKVIFLVFVSLFSSAFTMTILFPFLPEMIKGFGYKEEEKGYYAGIVASAMFLGRGTGSFFWGWLSDRRGRRPVMLITIVLNGICSLAFGFTTNIVYAFVTRFLTGLVNGTVITAKTVLYEISDNTNQAVGMSVVSVAWGIGIILGPTVGGYLASPCKRYPDTFPAEGLFYNFPYLIPGAFAFLICLFGFVIDLIWLPETLSMKNQDLEIHVSAEDIHVDPYVHDKLSLHNTPTVFGSKSYLCEVSAAISVEDLHCESDAATYLAKTGKEIHLTKHGIEFTDVKGKENKAEIIKNEVMKTRKEVDQNGVEYYVDSECDIARNTMSQNDLSENSIAVETETDHRHLNEDFAVVKTESDAVESEKLLRTGGEGYGKRDCSLVNGETVGVRRFSESGKSRGCHVWNWIKNLSFVKLIFQFDVFLVTSLYAIFSFGIIGVEEILTVWCATEIRYDGLGFEPNEIGAVMGSSSIPLLLLQFVLFPNLVRRFGAKKTFIGCQIVLVISVTVLPTLHLLVDHSSALWVLLISDNIVMKIMTSCVFSATGLFINNSIAPDQVGSVNGLSMTVTAIVRSISPIVGGAVFSWTVSYSSENIGPPFDVSFTFFMFGFTLWLLTVWGITIPERLNNQKK